jgi:hypothetical protein
LRNGRYDEFVTSDTRSWKFSAGLGGTGQETTTVDVQPGKTSYVRCSVKFGLMNKAIIEQVDEKTAGEEMEGLEHANQARRRTTGTGPLGDVSARAG